MIKPSLRATLFAFLFATSFSGPMSFAEDISSDLPGSLLRETGGYDESERSGKDLGEGDPQPPPASGQRCKEYSQAYPIPNNLTEMFSVPTGEVVCVGKACLYNPREQIGPTLKNLYPTAVFGNDRKILGIDEGYNGKGGVLAEIAFWHECKEVLEDMKRMVKALDVPVKPSGRQMMNLSLKIYSVSSEKYHDLAVGLTGIYDGEVNPPLPDGSPAPVIPRGTLDLVSGISILNLAFGNLTNHMLNVKLSAGRGDSSAREVRDVGMIVHNGEYFTRHLYRNVHLEGYTDMKQEEVGYHVSGSAWVSRRDDGSWVITVRGFQMNYSRPIDDGKDLKEGKTITEQIPIEQHEMVLTPGRPYVVFSDNVRVEGKGRNGQLPAYYESSSMTKDSKFMIFLSGWPANEPPDEKTGVTRASLSAEQVAALPEVSEKNILSTADFSVASMAEGAAGFDLIRMRLSPEALSKANYNKRIQIKISGPGLSNNDTTILVTQHLALNAFQFPAVFDVNGKNKGVNELKAELSWLTDPPRDSSKKKSVYKLLYFRDEAGMGESGIEVIKQSSSSLW